MASYGQPSSHQPPHQQQQQQQAWNPLGAMANLAAASASGSGGADATAQMGLQFGSQVFGAGQNYVEQTVRPVIVVRRRAGRY